MADFSSDSIRNVVFLSHSSAGKTIFHVTGSVGVGPISRQKARNLP